jgi:hypothetical protein
MPPRSAFLALTLLLAACKGVTGYPSLQPRAVEEMSLAEPAAKPSQPREASPEATARYAPMVEKAENAHKSFTEAMGRERERIVRGRSAPAGSDAWTDAQEALSRVETTRTPISTILADLDAARSSALTRTNSGELTAATTAYERVKALDDEETQALAAAQGKGL